MAFWPMYTHSQLSQTDGQQMKLWCCFSCSKPKKKVTTHNFIIYVCHLETPLSSVLLVCATDFFSRVFSYIAVCWPLRVIVDGQIIIVVVQRFLLSFLASYVLVTMQDHKSSQVCREHDYLNNITWDSLVWFTLAVDWPYPEALLACLNPSNMLEQKCFLWKKSFKFGITRYFWSG